MDVRMNARPTKDILMVEPLEVEGLTSKGFLLPGTVTEWIPPQQGKVLAVGRDITKVAVGDKILYGLESGVLVLGMLFLREGDIICEMD